MKPHAFAEPGTKRRKLGIGGVLILILLIAFACKKTESYTSEHPLLNKSVEELTDEEISQMAAVVITNYGVFKFQFHPEWAPKTCRHFINLVKTGYYRGLQFYEIRSDTWIRAGNPEVSAVPAATEAVALEYPKGTTQVLHEKGAVGLYHPDYRPNEGGKEFYVMLRKYPEMDGGFTAFGRVVDGLDVVDRIGSQVTTPPDGKPRPYMPLNPVRIEKIYLEVKK